MTSEQNAADLAALKRKREELSRTFHQTMADIKVRRTQLDEQMAELAELGCSNLNEASDLEADLQQQIDQQVREIRELLA